MGTSSPNSTLHVAGSLTVNDRIFLQRASSSLNLAIASYWDGTTNPLNGTKGDIVAIGNAGGDGVAFVNANTERMRLTSTGLGIGTSSPSTLLHVSGPTGTTFTLDGANDYSSTAAILMNQGRSEIRTTIAASGGNPGGSLLFRTRNNSGSLVDAVTIDSSQRVGIGTTSPSHILHLKKSDASDAYCQYENSVATTYFGTGSTGNTFVYNNSAKPIEFYTNATERARIDSSGRLLVGTSTSLGNGLLQVKGEVNIQQASGGADYETKLTSNAVSFTDISTTATSGLPATNGPGLYMFTIRTIGNHSGTFLVSAGIHSGSNYYYAGFGASGNVTLTNVSNGTITVVLLGDARTYTFAWDTAGSAPTFRASSTATGVTLVAVTSISTAI